MGVGGKKHPDFQNRMLNTNPSTGGTQLGSCLGGGGGGEPKTEGMGQIELCKKDGLKTALSRYITVPK